MEPSPLVSEDDAHAFALGREREVVENVVMLFDPPPGDAATLLLFFNQGEPELLTSQDQSQFIRGGGLQVWRVGDWGHVVAQGKRPRQPVQHLPRLVAQAQLRKSFRSQLALDLPKLVLAVAAFYCGQPLEGHLVRGKGTSFVREDITNPSQLLGDVRISG